VIGAANPDGSGIGDWVAAFPSSDTTAWSSRRVPVADLVAHGGELERFVHLARAEMARYVIAFAGCPRWRDPGHRDGEQLVLTLWLTPTTARCSTCSYLEPLTAWMERIGWEWPD